LVFEEESFACVCVETALNSPTQEWFLEQAVAFLQQPTAWDSLRIDHVSQKLLRAEVSSGQHCAGDAQLWVRLRQSVVSTGLQFADTTMGRCPRGDA